eukprot:TRINITY_DN1538_c0_g1_i1.p1 TRINITY_DN1538_c0_g1~~TRINITY_DN1538_c0_g1_i1.p1  ORF type:complete len:378 (+),score=50.90 TRINITY_DN1538_c0_g1_i1:908-2041(+)
MSGSVYLGGLSDANATSLFQMSNEDQLCPEFVRVCTDLVYEQIVREAHAHLGSHMHMVNFVKYVLPYSSTGGLLGSGRGMRWFKSPQSLATHAVQAFVNKGVNGIDDWGWVAWFPRPTEGCALLCKPCVRSLLGDYQVAGLTVIHAIQSHRIVIVPENDSKGFPISPADVAFVEFGFVYFSKEAQHLRYKSQDCRYVSAALVPDSVAEVQCRSSMPAPTEKNPQPHMGRYRESEGGENQCFKSNEVWEHNTWDAVAAGKRACASIGTEAYMGQAVTAQDFLRPPDEAYFDQLISQDKLGHGDKEHVGREDRRHFDSMMPPGNGRMGWYLVARLELTRLGRQNHPYVGTFEVFICWVQLLEALQVASAQLPALQGGSA